MKEGASEIGAMRTLNRLSSLVKSRGSSAGWIAIALVIISGCSRTSVPLGGLQSTSEAFAATRSVATHIAMAAADSYAVVWIPDSETLRFRDPAGIAGVVVGELPHDFRGVEFTGRTTSLGSSLWMEARMPDGEIGWVNSWNLTEDVPPEEFCTDPRVADLILEFVSAVENRDGERLSSLVNPRRGLVIRHDWWNPDVIIPKEVIPGIFTDTDEQEWGSLSGGDFRITGSFSEVILPQIDESMGVSGWVCNSLPIGTTSREAIWPSELSTLNYMAHHMPAPGDGSPFEWRTLTIGIEYMDGQPYLTLITVYRGDV